MKNVKSMGVFHFKNMANFEASHKGISSSINLLFLKSVQLSRILRREKNQAHYFLSNHFYFPHFYILPNLYHKFCPSSGSLRPNSNRTKFEYNFFWLKNIKRETGFYFSFCKMWLNLLKNCTCYIMSRCCLPACWASPKMASSTDKYY